MAINKTDISILQELMVAKHKSIPDYSFRSVGTEIQPRFSCSVLTSYGTFTAEARNKKDAKQLAAKCALTKLGFKVSTGKEKVPPTNDVIYTLPSRSYKLPVNFIENNNYIGELHELASRSGCNYPFYESSFCMENGKFEFICKFKDFETVGYADNKKQAKQIASSEMILLLKSGKINLTTSSLPKEKFTTEFSEHDMEVLKKFEMISLKGHTVPSASPYSEGYPKMEKNLLTQEKAIDELRKHNVTYKILELQRNPYVMVVEVCDKKITLLGCGSTKNEATVKALNKTLEVLQEGCSLIS